MEPRRAPACLSKPWLSGLGPGAASHGEGRSPSLKWCPWQPQYSGSGEPSWCQPRCEAGAQAGCPRLRLARTGGSRWLATLLVAHAQTALGPDPAHSPGRRRPWRSGQSFCASQRGPRGRRTGSEHPVGLGLSPGSATHWPHDLGYIT